MAEITYFHVCARFEFRARKIAMNKDGSANKDISFVKTVFEIYIRYSSILKMAKNKNFDTKSV